MGNWCVRSREELQTVSQAVDFLADMISEFLPSVSVVVMHTMKMK